MIKNIFFDIGNVLIHIHPDRCAQHWADSADLPLDVIKDAFPLETHDAYEKGELSGHEFFLALRGALPQPCCLKESDFWRGWQKLLGDETMVSQLLKLLFPDYNIWLLSNTNSQHIKDEINLRYNFTKYIDGAIYSFDAASRKPDVAIYEYALKKSGAMASESVFIDDLLPNIEAVNSLGWKGIDYQNINQLINELDKFGVKIKELESMV